MTYLLKEINTKRYVLQQSKAKFTKGTITINGRDWKCYKIINAR